ncbi:hypothetical protein INS49_015621 [Diaporthe citri]|uniref:uncharacterized protein n=1 Tax=Diaporthe citri TaxID=83186 RepID=UPI001C7F0014|nr:uncharacterized protein INS49_015621 [Diaporthe citri]KAG6356234.1 hypothetical protein INS49_015621 [Diaporthe citri]
MASNYLAQAEVVLLTDEPYACELDHLGPRVVSVPASFTRPRARYKARALEYFRIAANLQPDDWILHLDEETMIDASVLEACTNFIAHETNFDIGQGFVFYNSSGFWANWLLTVADLTRIVDDMGKLFFQSFVVHRPYWGLRGSFLLLSGAVENEVGWDTDCLTEDYDFSWRRRRWYQGVWTSGILWGKVQLALSILGAFMPESVLQFFGLTPRISLVFAAVFISLKLAAPCLIGIVFPPATFEVIEK